VAAKEQGKQIKHDSSKVGREPPLIIRSYVLKLQHKEGKVKQMAKAKKKRRE